jgi:hypothetical protein
MDSAGMRVQWSTTAIELIVGRDDHQDHSGPIEARDSVGAHVHSARLAQERAELAPRRRITQHALSRIHSTMVSLDDPFLSFREK